LKGLVFNWDETGVSFVDLGKVTLEQVGAKQVRILGHNDKRQCTVVTGTCADGATMPLGVIFTGQPNSRRAIPKCQRWPNNWWSFQTKSHWMTEAALRSYYIKVCILCVLFVFFCGLFVFVFYVCSRTIC
jgi:hypothetical protein